MSMTTASTIWSRRFPRNAGSPPTRTPEKNGFEKEQLFDIPLEQGVNYETLLYDFDDTTGTLTVIYPILDAIILASKTRADAFQTLTQRRIEMRALLLLTAVDINADHRADVFVLDETSFAVHLSIPNDQFDRIELAERHGLYLPSVIHGDFDQNGVQDVAIASIVDQVVHVLGTANGRPEVRSTTAGAGTLLFANDDSWPDLIGAYWDPRNRNRMWVAYGLGGGELELLEERRFFCNCIFVQVFNESYDFNENGRPDHVGYTNEGMVWVEISSGNVRPLGEVPFLGAAKMKANSPPAIIYGQDTMRAAYVTNRAITVRDTPPLIATEKWSCFGVFDGTRVAVAPSKTSSTAIIRGRETIEVSGGVDFHLSHKFCTPALFADDRSGFLIYGDQRPFVIREKRDGTYAAVTVFVDRNSPFPVSDEPLSQPWVVGQRIVRVTAHGVEFLELEGDTFVTTSRGLLRAHGERVDTGNPTPPFAGFINDDDLVDVVYPNDNVTLFFGKPSPPGELSFDEVVLDPSIDAYPAVRVLDFDGDRDLDIAVETRLVPMQIVLYENDGDGNFTRHAELDRIFDARVIGSCDLDGDHRRDLLFGFDDAIGYILRDRDGGLGEQLHVVETFTAALEAFPAQNDCWDYDGDGLDDFIFRESSTGTIHVFYNGSK